MCSHSFVKSCGSICQNSEVYQLKEDIPLSENAPGGMTEFCRSLTLSFFFKIFLSVTHEMKIKGLLEDGLHADHLSAVQPYSRPVTVGTQSYELVRQGTSVGQPMVHMSAMLQVVLIYWHCTLILLIYVILFSSHCHYKQPFLVKSLPPRSTSTVQIL